MSKSLEAGHVTAPVSRGEKAGGFRAEMRSCSAPLSFFFPLHSWGKFCRPPLALSPFQLLLSPRSLASAHITHRKYLPRSSVPAYSQPDGHPWVLSSLLTVLGMLLTSSSSKHYPGAISTCGHALSGLLPSMLDSSPLSPLLAPFPA